MEAKKPKESGRKSQRYIAEKKSFQKKEEGKKDCKRKVMQRNKRLKVKHKQTKNRRIFWKVFF